MTESLMGLHVAVVGDPIDGIEIFGPFKTGCEAVDWLASCDLNGWIVPLQEPVAEDEE